MFQLFKKIAVGELTSPRVDLTDRELVCRRIVQ